MDDKISETTDSLVMAFRMNQHKRSMRNLDRTSCGNALASSNAAVFRVYSGARIDKEREPDH